MSTPKTDTTAPFRWALSVALCGGIAWAGSMLSMTASFKSVLYDLKENATIASLFVGGLGVGCGLVTGVMAGLLGRKEERATTALAASAA